MPSQISSADPVWTFQPADLERQVAIFAKANGISSQAAWDAFVAGVSTTAQAVAICKGLLSSFHPTAAV